MNVAQETLGLRRGSFSLPLSLLMSAFALPIPPADLTIHLRRLTERSPTNVCIPFNPLIHRNCALRLAAFFIEGRLDVRRLHPSSKDDSTFAVALVSAALFERLTSPAKLSLPQAGDEWTEVECIRPAASVYSLSPVTSSAQDDSTTELLRFL